MCLNCLVNSKYKYILNLLWLIIFVNSSINFRLLAAILFQLAREGWQILQSLDPTRKQNDKDTMFFEIAKPDPHAEIFVMSFNRFDRIRWDAYTRVPSYVKLHETHLYIHNLKEFKIGKKSTYPISTQCDKGTVF